MQKQIPAVKKPVRTISGVTPLTVVLKPRKCAHGTCIYCPGGEFVPQSYTNKSPAIMRALVLRFDPRAQVENRLNTLNLMNHPTDKIELIILGGTFMQYPEKYKDEFIKKCFDALNGKDSKNLEEAKKINETAKNRCVAMCIENRPDNCSAEDIKKMLSYGCTRVEIGVQMPDDKLYKKTNRGHSVKDVVEATRKLKDAGFKVGYHIMPGLPGSDEKKDLRLFKKIFDYENFRPDQLKIYPCQIISDSPLEKIYKKIKFKPYSEKQTREILEKMMKMIPEYCRVMRVMREFPKEKLIDGVEKLDLRKDIELNLRKNKIKIGEIRMREIGFNKISGSDLKLKILEYNASEGKEFFLQFVNDENILFGLLRLRISNSKAIIRELHVYGQAIALGEKSIGSQQHKGLGKLLMEKAEGIARKNGIKKISVISGVGVREYYRNLGYELEGNYMVKMLQ
ncbi:tRNA uridine(34) 5-carboxymethylaminomethyl modification radical SAM/GNAT enzyme Elp3 [Candidatus Pacearchaeota archaeon]|nr:tRNA uridine(34) 5-carboxymethylaminomethyl modification radical SAM/GNAT enzyme Elp3 [Candidatus Pacearchaeota archaeon]